MIVPKIDTTIFDFAMLSNYHDSMAKLFVDPTCSRKLRIVAMERYFAMLNCYRSAHCEPTSGGEQWDVRNLESKTIKP